MVDPTDRPIFTPDLDQPDTWAHTIGQWRTTENSVLSFEGLGTEADPVPTELLDQLADHEGRISSVNFNRASLADADFSGATFTAEAYFFGATFNADASFSGATFTADADFIEATFTADASFIEATFTADADFIEATFTADAYFIEATFTADADFSGATFNADASFFGATFNADASFIEATFNADASFRRATFNADADFSGATFTADVVFDSISSSEGLDFDRVVFGGQRHTVTWTTSDAETVAVVGKLRVEGDLNVFLGDGVIWDATGLEVRAPVTITAPFAQDPDVETSGGQLASLVGADITAPFRIGRFINLKTTQWGDHDLTAITLADTSSLPRTSLLNKLPDWDPPALIKEMFAGRHRLAADTGRPTDDLAVLEGNYRDLRRQLEATQNTHGANDFYRGEMDARRRQLPAWSPHRWLLETYRLVSGYGTRAWTAIATWALATVIATLMLQNNGIDIDEERYYSFDEVWRFTAEGSLSFFRPTAAPLLSVPETIIMLTMRIIGPALLALAAIAIRNQTKR